MTDYTDTITTFIRNEMMANKKVSTISSSDSLITKGIIDSLGVQILIAYLEKEFGITIPDNEILPQNFETVNSIGSFVNYKLTAKGMGK